MNIDAIWDKLYSQKLDWAYRGREKFYESIEDQMIKDLFKASDKQINVCVYGRSQVGKTTLILKLIGIKQENIQVVGNILRGKRKRGNSATIVATVYSMSIDDYFYYEEVNGQVEKLDEDGIESKLSELRNKAYCGNASIDKVKISIPKKYFDVEQLQMDINIIDLPGIESADKKEYDHVAKIVRKFVPISNMILLIERADQVAYLRNIDIPGIEAWHEDIERFKLILTRSVSNNSTRTQITQIEDIDKEDYVKLFEEDINKDVYVDISKNVIFPLEYGESWDNLKNTDKVLVQSIQPILDELYQDLIKEIIASQNIYNQFIMEGKMLKRIEKLINKNRGNICCEINSMRNKHKEAISEGLKLSQRIEKQKSGINEIAVDIEETDRISHRNIHFQECVFDGKSLRVSSLKEFVEVNIEKIINKSRKFIDEITENMDEDKYGDDIRDLINNISLMAYQEAAQYLGYLESYFWDTYFIDSNFENDKIEAKNLLRKINSKIKDYINCYLKGIATDIKALLNEEIEGKRSKVVKLVYELDHIMCEVLEYKHSVDKLKKDLEIFEDRSKSDSDKVKKFRNAIYESYDQEINEFSEKINRTTAPAEEKLIYIFYIYLISDELSKIEGAI